MAATLVEHISLDKSRDYYVSKHFPQRMGNPASIAYGGYAIALSIHAAYQSVPAEYHLYSVFGHFLRAVSSEKKLICRTFELRKTRNFVSYRVTVEQQANSAGESQLCMEVLTDFHKDEPSLLTYSAPPTRKYSHWKNCPPWNQLVQEDWIKSGNLTEQQAKTFTTLFGLSESLYEKRPCPEGIAFQNLSGLAKTIRTDQDELSPTTKSSAEWIRVKHPFQTEGEQMAGLGFIMDEFLSFLPLVHNHLFLDDVSVCSSLDFALRIFVPSIQMNNWHLRESCGHSSAHGRTYSESRVWDEQGNLVACMTENSVLRVPAEIAKI